MDAKPTATLYEPRDESQAPLSRYFNRIPRFLLRTSSQNSGGNTSPTRVESEAVKRGLPGADILGRPDHWTVNSLKAHLLWRRCEDNNFVSWTSSIVFALQHAIRKANGGKGCRREHPSTISILIIDTHKVPLNVFLPTLALLDVYGLNSDPDLRPSYYEGEYLSQGSLILPPGCAVSATLEQLQSLGINRIYDEPNKSYLWSTVNTVRQNIRDGPPQIVTDLESRTIETIAQGICHENERLKMAFAFLLLSIKPRSRFSAPILQRFATSEWNEWMATARPEPIAATSANVPEHQQFVQMLYDIHDRAQHRKEQLKVTKLEERLSSQLAKLSIASGEDIQSSTTTRSVGLAMSTISHRYYNLGPKVSTAETRETADMDRVKTRMAEMHEKW